MNIYILIGTRPNFIKVTQFKKVATEKFPDLKISIIHTGQHYDEKMADVFFRQFNLIPDYFLNIAPASPNKQIADILIKLEDLTDTIGKPDIMLVPGDVNSTLAGALFANKHNIKLGHIEAGLRSFNMAEPFPEEANRRLTDVLTDLDLPPTRGAADNILREGKINPNVVVTGQTEVDAVLYASSRGVLPNIPSNKRIVAMTMHRRENLPFMADLAAAMARVANAHPECHFVYPVHLNPAVRDAVYPSLQPLENFSLLEPLDFGSMAALMKASSLIVTDSGGLQEGGATLGVPVVVLRNVTERPEGLAVGALKLAGTDPENVFKTIHTLLSSDTELGKMQNRPNPYGDGHAGIRCAQAVAWRLGLAKRPKDWQ